MLTYKKLWITLKQKSYPNLVLILLHDRYITQDKLLLPTFKMIAALQKNI